MRNSSALTTTIFTPALRYRVGFVTQLTIDHVLMNQKDPRRNGEGLFKKSSDQTVSEI
jgi:hypothetical protein